MEEKDGIVMYENKIYKLDDMSLAELNDLIVRVENKQKELIKEVLEYINNN